MRALALTAAALAAMMAAAYADGGTWSWSQPRSGDAIAAVPVIPGADGRYWPVSPINPLSIARPAITHETAFSCTSADGPIAGLPTGPVYLRVQNPGQLPGAGTVNVTHVFIDWAGGNSAADGFDLAPGDREGRIVTVAPHCSVPAGEQSVSIIVGWAQ